ncbi:DUF502 domain-containing protein [Candidatus Dependentiae bacterium]|nr:DUF502 domain-containing protein [Candidatus Dependentiae bacterium]
MEFKDLFQKPLEYIQHLFITGLLFLLPITITFSIFHFFLNVIKRMLVPIRNFNIPIISKIPHYEILLLILFIFIIGILIKAFILKPIIHILEESLSKIPMINTVYKGIKQLVYAFSSHDQTSFKKVVIIEYPRQGIYSIGFLTKQIPAEVTNHNLVGVYIPHTPNPASGNFIMISSENIQEINLTRQEATALIISGGIVQPNRFKK